MAEGVNRASDLGHPARRAGVLRFIPADAADAKPWSAAMTEVLAALRHEFEAGEGSFLHALRCDLHWSREGFLRLVGAMQAYVEANPERESLERWIAEGFWYVSWFVREWSSHREFPHDYEAGYYQRAYERLFDLAFWFFSGNCPDARGTLSPFAMD